MNTIMPIITMITFALACLSRRLMGGLIARIFPWWPGTQAARVLWFALMLAWAASLAALVGSHAPMWYLIAITASWPIGSAVYGNNGMGLDNSKDVERIAIHGVVMNVIAAAATAWYAPYAVWLLVPATMIPLFSYWVARRWPLNIPMLGCYTYDRPPTGELLMGVLETLLVGTLVLLTR